MKRMGLTVLKLIIMMALWPRIALSNQTASAYSGWNLSEIVEMNGTNTNPMIRVVLDLYEECLTSTVVTHSSYYGHDFVEEDGPHCKKYFDGFTCWDETPAGATAFKNCPDFVVGFDGTLIAYKKCTSNGTWKVHEQTMKPWTNYSTCVNTEDLLLRSIINNIYISGYIVSSIALIACLWVFHYYKSLYCLRILIHIHWFSANLISNILWVLWHKVVVENVKVVQDNPIWCQGFNVIIVFFTAASNLWMFNEGFFLFLALVVVFVKEQSIMPWLVFIGWIFPAIITTIYACIRFTYPESRVRCWMDYHDTFWIIILPILISLVISLIIFISVLWVVNKKTTTLNTQYGHRKVSIMKTVRAGFILMPLFGLQYMLLPISPAPGTTIHAVYHIAAAICTSFQGFCVSMLFCYTNQDVVQVVRTHLAQVLHRRIQNIPMTAITAGESVAPIRDNVF